ncbi:MAG: Hpt domain-containing protein, partial [Spirochaetia bacterium]|nr:Hpt domain-containing protein [Spirochaetia bacterium]
KGDLVPLFSKWLIVGDEVADLEELDPVPEKSRNSIHVNNGKPVVLPKAPPAGTLTGGTAAKAVMPEMIDYNDALDTFMGEKQILLETLAEFSARVEKQLPVMKILLEKKDFETLRREAHSIKGGALSLAARVFGNIAGKLEKSAAESDAGKARENFEKLKHLFPLLKNEIKRLTG